MHKAPTKPVFVRPYWPLLLHTNHVMLMPPHCRAVGPVEKHRQLLALFCPLQTVSRQLVLCVVRPHAFARMGMAGACVTRLLLCPVTTSCGCAQLGSFSLRSPHAALFLSCYVVMPAS